MTINASKSLKSCSLNHPCGGQEKKPLYCRAMDSGLAAWPDEKSAATSVTGGAYTELSTQHFDF